jgi:DNA invertase Pin-like site-specific DNA recombinase
LRLAGRDALARLIADVTSGRADFTTILVYDVSRWGRFQDPDEGGHYEFICKKAGIKVQYCAEQFDNDGSPVSTIVKGVKRAMAGEYSRELSAKVFAGQCRLIELGFRQGGAPGFGLRRCLVDQSSSVKGELARGEHKSIQTDRVILVPGPAEEIDMVRWIYRGRPSSPDQREVHWQQCLEPNLLQAETAACTQWSRELAACKWCVHANRRSRTIRGRPRHDRGALTPFHERGIARYSPPVAAREWLPFGVADRRV